jgi:ribosomal protein L13E
MALEFGLGGGDPRTEALRALKLASPAKAHEMVTTGLRHGAAWLLRRGLNAQRLKDLGYTADGMRKLGCDEGALAQLGYREARPAKSASAPQPVGERTPGAPAESGAEGEGETAAVLIRRLVDGGVKASELGSRGYSLPQVKKAGVSSMELAHLGYNLSELVTVCSVQELRRADFNARELKRYFGGDELRRANYTADEMRLSGFSVGELLRYGYPENQVRSAGFSTSDLLREGLSRTTRI